MNPAKDVILNGRYRLTEKIGRGGMAEVWMAQDMALSRAVAIKLMLPEFATSPDFSRRFRQEAAAAANLRSPYIVNIYDHGQEDETTQYIVMEYVPGQDLKTIISENGPLPQKKAAKLGAQVCQALAAAHHQDIIHRDIKPQNIMVQPDGNIKVMDFGIARAKNSTEQRTTTVLGTAHYVSPEQAQGKNLTAASDIYSLGIVLYEAVTGRVPFDGEEAMAVALKQVEQQPMPPSRIVPNMDPQLEEIIMRALRKNPAERYLSALDMGRALEAFATGRRDFSSATTQVIGNGTTPRNFNTATTTMMSPNGSQPTQYGEQDQVPEEDDNDEEASSKKKRNLIIAGAIAACVAVITAVVLFLTGGQSVAVPDVTGMTPDEAKVALEAQGLEIGKTEEKPSADIPKGAVSGTDPKAGAETKKGSKVTVIVSSGKEQVKVPDVSKMSEEEAVKAIEDAGLKAARGASKHSREIAEGQVVDQSPAAGETIDAGDTVTYSLSSGADNVTVPDLSGMTEEEAMKALEDVGLKGLVGSRQASDTVASGQVISQNPISGIKVEDGTQITFTVSTGLVDITVPSLLGLTQAAARSTLVNAGFTMGDVTEEFSDEPKGSVISQSLAEGSTAKKGTVVNLTISKGPEPKPENTNSNTNGNSNRNTNSNSNSNANGNSNDSNSGADSEPNDNGNANNAADNDNENGSTE